MRRAAEQKKLAMAAAQKRGQQYLGDKPGPKPLQVAKVKGPSMTTLKYLPRVISAIQSKGWDLNGRAIGDHVLAVCGPSEAHIVMDAIRESLPSTVNHWESQPRTQAEVLEMLRRVA